MIKIWVHALAGSALLGFLMSYTAITYGEFMVIIFAANIWYWTKPNETIQCTIE